MAGGQPAAQAAVQGAVRTAVQTAAGQAEVLLVVPAAAFPGNHPPTRPRPLLSIPHRSRAAPIISVTSPVTTESWPGSCEAAKLPFASYT